MSRYDSKFISSYYYKGTEVLRNKKGYRDPEKLRDFETLWSYIRTVELLKNPIIGFKMKDLKKIHKYIFQDVYYFAGKLRTEGIKKGNTQFYLPEAIEENLIRVFGELKDEKLLKNLDKEDFIDRSSYYLAELNIIHPFREGNGRAIREFIRCLALYNDHIIDWTQIKDEEFIQASIDSVYDHKVFIKYIKKCLK